MYTTGFFGHWGLSFFLEALAENLFSALCSLFLMFSFAAPLLGCLSAFALTAAATTTISIFFP